jgi:origin recognition complex subunit 2
MQQLERFHLSCRRELDVLLESFNILFYGYGSKEGILGEMFPEALIFNCKILRPEEILNGITERLVELHPQMEEELKCAGSLRRMDELLASREEKIKVVLLNFDFEKMAEFTGLKNMALLATVETMGITFSYEDIERYNFIFRDLTTYRPYSVELHDIQLSAGRSEVAMGVIRNVPKNSRVVMKELLESSDTTVTVDELFEKVKRKLFLKSKNSIFPLINEFIDHGILKMRDNVEMTINLSAADRRRILEKLEDVE